MRLCCAWFVLASTVSLNPIPVRANAQGGRTPDAISDAYRDQAQRIITAALEGNDAWRKLEELCDGIGHRLSGSESLERAIDWAVGTLQKDGMEARREAVAVTRWVRGRESAEMIEPRREAIAMLGLGGSVATPAEGITADVVCVRDREALMQLGRRAVEGKVVLFNYPMKQYDPVGGTGYGDAVRFRGAGADWASEFGAVAALIRSVTATSLRSPHTGAMRYRGDVPKIPAAAISTEDADMIERLTRRDQKVVVNLKMECRDEGSAPSANVIGELRGREKPEEIVVISGHLDSWDVGQGAHDDGVGCVTAMEAVNVLRKLNLIPRRTIRVVLWTNEENGLAGAREYVKLHAEEMPRHFAAIEMDSGGFAPTGYSVDFADERESEAPALAGSEGGRTAAIDRPASEPRRRQGDRREPRAATPGPKAARALEQMTDIARLLDRLGAGKATLGGSGADVGVMRAFGVPLLGHNVEQARYFDYHHSHADTLDKILPLDVSKNVAAMAVVAYVLADMPGKLGE